MNFFYFVFVITFGFNCLECFPTELTTISAEDFGLVSEHDEYYTEYYDENEDYYYEETYDDEYENDYGDYGNASMPFIFLIAGGVRANAGREAAKGMVSLRTRTPRKYFGDNHFCSGMIIAPDVVLTAAHCVMDKRKVLTAVRRILVIAGTPNRLEVTNTTIQMPVKALRAHPLFEKKGTNDVALIFLRDPLPENNSEIRINRLPSKPFEWTGYCMTIGWGRLYYNGPLAARPVTLYLTIDSPHECSRVYKLFAKEGLLCSSDPVLWYKDPCRGDSGAGLFCEGELRGINSWTISCGSNDIPSLFTDVYYNLPWIKQEMAKGIACRLGTNFMILTFLLTLEIYIIFI